MSQTNKFPKLEIRNKKPGSVSVGANTEVTLDGKKIPNLSFIKVEIHSRKIAKVTMEMYVDADIQIEPGDATVTIKKVQGWHQILGSYVAQFFK